MWPTARAVSGRTQGANAPIVLPVMFNATGAELAAAKKQYQRILKAPTKNQSFLEAIDDALVVRSAAEREGRRISFSVTKIPHN